MKLIVRLSLFAFILLGQEALAQKDQKGIFWEVSGNGLTRPSYLFGTYHVLNSGYLTTVPKVKEAFDKASGVIVETTIDSSKLMQLTPLMMMADKKISDLVSEDDYALISKEFEAQTGMALTLLNQFKPYLIATMLSMSYNQKQNKEELEKYSGRPIDIYFAAEAKRLGKPVQTFETMEEQMKILLDHDPVEEQAKQLVEMVKTRDEVVTSQKELLQMYLQQDLAAMQKMMKKFEAQYGDTKHLLDDRNVNWMEKLPGMLKGGNQFMAVGAAHFTGEKSLLKLLKDMGYTVKTLTVK